jgi:hypothetical protein
VQSVLGLATKVHSLDNVDLTARGPVWTQHPKRRPCSTCIFGHVCNIGNDETMCVRAVPFQPNTFSSSRADGSIIGPKLNICIKSLRQPQCLGTGVTLVAGNKSIPSPSKQTELSLLYIAMCGIIYGSKVEFAKEVAG